MEHINEKTIDIITKLYDGDVTKARLDEKEKLMITARSGIREGCTGSRTLQINNI